MRSSLFIYSMRRRWGSRESNFGFAMLDFGWSISAGGLVIFGGSGDGDSPCGEAAGMGLEPLEQLEEGSLAGSKLAPGVSPVDDLLALLRDQVWSRLVE